MKRFLSVILVLLMAMSILPTYAQEGENLIRNGDFSQLDSAGMPVDWSRDMWHKDAGISSLFIAEDGYEGSCAVVINADPNDARFAQTIEVKPNSYYRFSCMVRAEGCGSEGYGATLSIKDTFVYSEALCDTAGEWKELVLYGQTGKKQKEVTLMARIGGYGMLNTGCAYFDNVEAVQLSEKPEGVEVFSLAKPESSSKSSSKTAAATADGMPKRNTEAYLLMAALYCLLILAIARRSHRFAAPQADLWKNNRRNNLQGKTMHNAEILMAVGLGIAFVLRILISCMVRGYNTDINCFSAWSERIFSNGLANFYAPDYFCDYPPGYMLMLWPVAALRTLLGASYQGSLHLILLKLIPVICDLLGAVLIWRVARKHRMHPCLAAILSLIYAFNPAVIIDSAAWGQIDSVFTLLVVICALQAADEKYISGLLAFAGAMLIKPQAMLFAPLGLIAIVVNLIRKPDRQKTMNALAGLGAALGLLYITAFVFCIGAAEGVIDAFIRPVGWMVNLYGSTMGSYAYITINALNLYQLLNLNWVAAETQPVWTMLAWILFGLSYVYCAFLYAKTKKNHRLLLCGGLLMVLIYTFGPMIHERYVYPAMLLLALAYACDRDKRLLASMTILTAVTAMNEILVLQGGMTEANYGHLQSSEQWLNALLSLANVVNALYLCWIGLDICLFGRVYPLRRPEDDAKHTFRLFEKVEEEKSGSPVSMDIPAPVKKDHRLHIRRIDCLLMVIVTLLYSAVAFVNLGVTSAPQTNWVSSQADETITFDLGRKESFRMVYYGGICNSNFRVELSNDGETWTEPVHAKYAQGEIFRWIYFIPCDEGNAVLYRQTDNPGDGSAYLTYATSAEPHPMQEARYVRITAVSAGLTLSEIGFWRADETLIDASIIDRSGEFEMNAVDPNLLLDEQDCVAAVPSYLNSSYFDEIYHARTAYEMLHGMSVYEWTHPPLGKTMMMLGIEIFGMTPFGWRFMGALVGVLMVPLMYLLAKQITKSTKLSFIAMCLMALDSMHFTQTRIATIDSYAVFWIMLMYLFMFRYVQMDFRQLSLRRTLVPLGLCGITMGIAMATKWIGAYAAVGLAVLFFWKIGSELCKAGEDSKAMIQRSLITCLFCLLFFIVIPVLIYYFSYIPQLRYEGVTGFADMFKPRWIERVVTLQQDILGYHAGLGGDTHYFRSPWYQWPVIWWPMWYYSGTEYMAEGIISSISCMGNPAVWWTGLIALIFVLVGCTWKRKAPKTWLMVLIGFASQFLPWVLVPRSTFIYHYFASVPFIILCTVLMLEWIREKDKFSFRWISAILLAFALVLFVAFYPLESGLPVSRAYAEHLRWFKWYNF